MAMNLAKLYQQEGAALLTALHVATGLSRKYIYQCATGRRSPSPAVAMRMIEADSRLIFEEMYSNLKKPAQ